MPRKPQPQLHYNVPSFLSHIRSRHASRPAAAELRDRTAIRGTAAECRRARTRPLPCRRCAPLCLSARRPSPPSLLSHSHRSLSSSLGLSCGAAATAVCDECARRQGRQQTDREREKSKLLLCCMLAASRASDLGRTLTRTSSSSSSSPTTTTNERLFVRCLSSHCDHERLATHLGLRPNERTSGRRGHRLADRVSECESVKLCLNGDVSGEGVRLWKSGRNCG